MAGVSCMQGGRELADIRLDKVPYLIDQHVERHMELAAGYSRLNGYLIHVFQMLTTIRRMRLCSDDRIDPTIILGEEYCTFKLIKTAGFMSEGAFRREFGNDCQEAAKRGIKAIWCDLNHDDCAGLKKDLEFGRELQNSQAGISREEPFANGIYIAGELETSTYYLTIRGWTPGGEEVVFTTDMARAAIPITYRTSNCFIEPYIEAALIATQGFHPDSLHLLAKLFKQSLFAPGKYPEGGRDRHSALFGATGLGMGWRSGDAFVVTAHLDNPESVADAERSMNIGISVIDANEEIEEDSPIIWFCTQTYDAANGNMSVVSEARAKASRMAMKIRQYPSLKNWFMFRRVVLVPAIIDRETGGLEPLKPIK